MSVCLEAGNCSISRLSSLVCNSRAAMASQRACIVWWPVADQSIPLMITSCPGNTTVRESRSPRRWASCRYRASVYSCRTLVSKASAASIWS